MEFEGKVVVVTGASSGIGRAYCQAFAGAGATVIACARTLGVAKDGMPAHNSLAETVQACEGLNGRVFAQACDVENEDDVKRAIAQTIANFGRIDVLINNAAIYPHYSTFDIDVDSWEKSMRVNVRGPFLTIREVAPHMIRQRAGSIVNLTSLSGSFQEKGHAGHEDLLLYSVTKAAVNRLSTFMSEELKEYGIAVNAMSPGAVDTETWNNHDPGAVATWKAAGVVRACIPEVVGPPILCLAGQTAATLTGKILHTDAFQKSWP